MCMCSFNSTGSSSLPFEVAEADGRYFVIYVDHENSPLCPLACGDEILGWNGEAIGEVVQRFFNKEFGRLPCTRSWFELALRHLTFRNGKTGLEPKKGSVEIDYLHDQDLCFTTLEWNTVPEYFPKENIAKSLAPSKKTVSQSPFEKLLTLQSALSPAYLRASLDHEENPFSIGSKRSFLPCLGPVLWNSWGKGPLRCLPV